MSEDDTRGVTWKGAACYMAGVYAAVFLLKTPRGERVMQQLDRLLFPPIITGEPRKER